MNRFFGGGWEKKEKNAHTQSQEALHEIASLKGLGGMCFFCCHFIYIFVYYFLVIY